MFDRFNRESAVAMLPVIRNAAKTINVEGAFSPSEIREAWEEFVRATYWLTTIDFSKENSTNCRSDRLIAVELTAKLARVNLEELDDNDSRTKGSAKIAMTMEEIDEWCQTLAAKEMISLANKRDLARQALNDFRKVKQVIGSYRSISVYFEASLEDAWPAADKIESEMELAKAYIDAAFSLVPNFRSAGFNAGYGENNLFYLFKEWDETDQLYRVFVPFDLADPEESSAEIKSAKGIALMRAVLEPPEEPEYPMTPEVQRLLDVADYE